MGQEPTTGLFNRIYNSKDTKKVSSEQRKVYDDKVTEEQTKLPLWKRYAQKGLENTIDAGMGLVGMGKETQGNLSGQLLGASLPFMRLGKMGGMGKALSLESKSPVAELNKDSALFIKNNPIKSESKPFQLPKYDAWGKPKDYGRVTIQSPTKKYMTIQELLDEVDSKDLPENIILDMTEGQGLAKYGYKLIG